MIGEDAHKKADILAAKLRNEEWYHRTTVVQMKINDIWNVIIYVWGTGPRPNTLEKSFDGYDVRWNRVSKKHPCPFGSVK